MRCTNQSLFTSEPVLVAEPDGASPPQNPLLNHFNPVHSYKKFTIDNILLIVISRLFPWHFATNILSAFHVSPIRSTSHSSLISPLTSYQVEAVFCAFISRTRSNISLTENQSMQTLKCGSGGGILKNDEPKHWKQHKICF